MTRTKNSVLEPTRTPLQNRAGALLNHIFSPDSRQAAARRAAARSNTLGADISDATAANSSSQQQLQPYGSCSSPTLGGGSPSNAQEAAASALQDDGRHLSGSLYNMGSMDEDDYSGLSDLLAYDDDDERLSPAELPAVSTAAVAAAAVAEMSNAAASNRQATQQQETEDQQQQYNPAPAANLPTAEHDPDHHHAVDGSAYILEISQPAQAPASSAAATSAEATAAVGQHTAEDLDGFHAVDKMLEQLSVDALLDQQYLLEQQQQQQHDVTKSTTASELIYSSSMVAKHQHAVMHRQSSAPLPFPTGPAAAATTVVLQAAGTAAMQAPTSATHQANIALVHVNSMNSIPKSWQQQQQQQQQQHLHHTYSAPLLDGQFDVIQHSGPSAADEISAKPFSFQELLMSDEPGADVTFSTSFDRLQGSALQQLSQQQQQLLLPPASHMAPWQQQQQQHASWEQQRHPHQQQQLYTAHSAPLPAAAATAPYRDGLLTHNMYSTSDLQAMQQHASAGQHGIIPFYHYHQSPPQQQQQGFAAHPGYINPHQAELEALKAQLAEEKRRRKEKKRMKKMHKLMQQQQQQQQQGLAHQVLHAAGPTNPAAAAAAAVTGAHGPPPYPAHFAPASSRSSRQPGLPQPPWFNIKPSSRDSARVPGPRVQGFGTHGSSSRASMGRTGSRELPEDPAAVAARQHAVAQSLRQLAFRSEQMQRAGSAGPTGTAAAVDVQHPLVQQPAAGRSSSTPPSTVRYSPYNRPPVSTPESGSCCRPSESVGAAEQLVAANTGHQQMPTAAVVLNLGQDSLATTPPAQQQDHTQSRNNSSSLMPDVSRRSVDDEFHSQQDRNFTAAASNRPDSVPRSGEDSWKARGSHEIAPATNAARALDLRSMESAPHALEAPSYCKLPACQVHSGEPHTAKIENMQRAASADAAAVIKVHGTPTGSTSTIVVGQASPHAAATGTAAAGGGTFSSPVSTTSSSSRKRSWNMTAQGSPLTLAGPERKLTAISSTAGLQGMHAHHMSNDSHATHEEPHHITHQQQTTSSNQQQQQQRCSPRGAQICNQPMLQEDPRGPCNQPDASGLNPSRGSAAPSAPGWSPALYHAMHDMLKISQQQQQQQQASEQRQQRLLQLPFNRADVVEQRRPTITTESPAAFVSPPTNAPEQQQQQQDVEGVLPTSHMTASVPAAAWEKHSTSSIALDLRSGPAASTLPTSPAAAAAAAGAAAPSFSTPAASGLPFSSPGVGDVGTSSTGGSFRRPVSRSGTATPSFSVPESHTTAAASGRLAAASTGVAGVPLPGLGSPRPPGFKCQQSLGDAMLAAGGAAGGAAAGAGGGGGGGGSGDFSGQLGGGFGNPAVYRTSSGKVLRMLTHPVTGKPLLLGPAVDAKSSRLGNTSLGAPSPQLFGLDLQHTHLGGISPTPSSAVQAVLTGAGAAGPHGGHAGSGSSGIRNGIWRQGSTVKQKRRSSSAAGVGAGSAGSGNEPLGLEGVQQWGSNVPAALFTSSDTYSQQQLSQVQLHMPLQALPIHGAAAGVAWGPDGAVPGSGMWSQQQQGPDAYADDGLLIWEPQQQQQQQQALSTQCTGKETEDVLAIAAAAAPAAGCLTAEEPRCQIDATADIHNVQP